MHQLLASCVLLAHLLGSVVAAPAYDYDYPSGYPEDVDDIEVDQGRLLELQAQGGDAVRDYLVDRPRGGCTADNLSIRREWRHMSQEDRKDYVDAVYCLQSMPSLFTEEEAPGARNLFDTFSVVHINQTQTIHGNFNFLAWHRYFVWVYEQTLKNECGYTGPIPYWEWGYDVEDPHASPVFDGSPYSMGSDGEPLEDRDRFWIQSPPPPIPIPPTGGTAYPAGLGGGCVMEGPFSDLTVHLGPISISGIRDTSDILSYNPRCLSRDLNPYIGQRYTSFNWTTWTIDESPDIVAFLSRLAGDPGQGHDNYTLNGIGVHGGGHLFVGGMTGSHSDFYASPQDPVFYLHHGQIDRVWSIWQWLDIEDRQDQAFGTLTFGNMPPSREGSLDDLIDLSPLAPPLPMREIMNTVEGPFCYYYE